MRKRKDSSQPAAPDSGVNYCECFALNKERIRASVRVGT